MEIKSIFFAIILTVFGTQFVFGAELGEKIAPLTGEPIFCADFTGSWVGQCKPSSKKNQTIFITKKISQVGCSSIYIDENFLNFGYKTTNIYENLEDSSGFIVTQTLQWEPDNLSFKNFGEVKNLADGSFVNGGSSLYKHIGPDQVNGSELSVESQETNILGETELYHCVYEKE